MISARVIRGLLAGALLAACGGHEGHTPEPAESTHQGDRAQTAAADDHAAHGDDHAAGEEPSEEPDPLANLRLNDGAKWPMDDHTRASFEKMVAALPSGDADTEAEALMEVGAELQVLLRELFQGCTMRGAAHDQLHYYLQGYIPAVQALSKTGSVEAANSVRYHLELYPDYFE